MSQSKPKTARPRGERPVRATESPRARQILDDRARRLAAPEATAADVSVTEAMRVLLCPMGGNLYGLPMAEVASLRPLERLGRTGVAGAGAVMGLVADNGRVRQVLDLGALLGAPPPQEADGYLVMLNGRRDIALRLAERPLAAQVRPDPDHPQRALVVSAGDDNAKTLVILSVTALLAGDASVGA
ncbi:MAG: chemotaxis protein CheW [Phenylobacterium sp.]|nr:chemotaxis protein CheW [Phenylobacterium sp.]